MMQLLAQVTLDEVFRSTQHSMNEGAGPERIIGLFLAIFAVIILLAALHHRRKREVAAKKLNHQGKLLKEVAKSVGIPPVQQRLLREMAEKQSAASPLVLLICPSLLVKGSSELDAERRKALGVLLERMRRA